MRFSEVRNRGRGSGSRGRRRARSISEAAAELELTELEERACGFARDSRAASTWRAYDSDFADFRAWCAGQTPAVEALPATPAAVALYLMPWPPFPSAATDRQGPLMRQGVLDSHY